MRNNAEARADWRRYCPICARVVTADKYVDVIDDDDGRKFYVFERDNMFVHDDIDHTREDLHALLLGIQ